MRMERAKGIEPSYAAWEAAVLPLNYARNFNNLSRFRFQFGFLLFFLAVLGCHVVGAG
jgi:hypothetical protein